MEWPKLKNLILIILALTNLFLLYFVVQHELQGRSVQWESRSNALEFLAQRGVQVEEGQVPKTVSLLARQVERDLEWERAAAQALLGENVQSDPRGGEVYRYVGEKGFIQFHSDGAFSAELDPAAFPVGEDRRAACEALLERMSFQGLLLEESGDQLTFRQLWEGVPLFSQQVTLVCREGGVCAMVGGRRLTGQPADDLSQQPITTATALISLLNGLNTLGDVCSRIDSIQEGYVSAASLTGPMTLVPVWRVVTDTGSYQLDTLTSQLTRVA